ncbi:HlyD family efflux transporter periplasmic adaptor subunit [Jeotgalibacillus sp. R-1-5s-1]|uniref:HlyD family efflux transporter periplasmic adaptor subunit n=1 Tax=Jeotgalibacillus sp. R-1-5s-1 TaxID=2555897 RepID=UPI00106DB06D|nr:HlyD family efflux transporter periplasmic adaptor subunit [Jeotgalibacillus sp. R-1-5s-1]TFD94490.1 HlyD family efflux transporter periplasmic adaptor subunit [Jeotgalibacillus sp. R-1-5s-1]
MSKNKRKKRGWMIGGIVVVAAVAIAGPLFAAEDQGERKTEEVLEETVTTYNYFSGNLSPAERTVVRADQMDTLTIVVEEGQEVSEGDVLAEGSQSTITAPESGTVHGVQAEDGPVTQGAPLMEIVDYQSLQAIVQIDESDIGSVSEGDEMTVRISASGEEVTGTIVTVSNEASANQTPSARAYFTAEVELEKLEGMRAGMTVEAMMVRDESVQVPTLSLDGIEYDDQDQAFVWVENDEGDLEKRFVETGLTDGMRIEITEGLSPGDRIVIEETSAGGGFAPPMMGGGGQ